MEPAKLLPFGPPPGADHNRHAVCDTGPTRRPGGSHTTAVTLLFHNTLKPVLYYGVAHPPFGPSTPRLVPMPSGSTVTNNSLLVHKATRFRFARSSLTMLFFPLQADVPKATTAVSSRVLERIVLGEGRIGAWQR